MKTATVKTGTLMVVSLTAVSAAIAQENAPRWPRALELEKATVVVYQPQLEKLDGVTLSGRAAFSWEAKGAAPVFGVFWFHARVLVDKGSRQVQVQDVKVRKVRLPNADTAQEQAVASVVEKEVPRWDLRPSLDDIQAAIAVSERQAKTDLGVHFSTGPAYGWYGPAGYHPPPYPPYGYRPPPPGYRPPAGYYPPAGYRPPAGSYPPGYRPLREAIRLEIARGLEARR